MSIRGIAFFLISALQISAAFASFTQLSSLKQLEEELNKADEKTLVVFDVDEVLITTEDHFGHPSSDKAFSEVIKKIASKGTTAEQKKEIEKSLSLATTLPKRVLIEKESPKIIQELQRKGVNVVALTSCGTGAFGAIPKLERWRIENLLSLNIDFGHSFSEVGRCQLKQIAREGMPAPLFEQGILFSKGYEKGAVLKAFLAHSNFTPSKVIFIDDVIKNLESAQAEMKAMNIEFIGYQYTGAKRLAKPANQEVIAYQFDHLMKTKQWLNDQEAMSLIKSHERMQESMPFPNTISLP